MARDQIRAGERDGLAVQLARRPGPTGRVASCSLNSSLAVWPMSFLASSMSLTPGQLDDDAIGAAASGSRLPRRRRR